MYVINASAQDEMLEILGEVKEELAEQISALEAADEDVVDEEEVPKHRKRASKGRGEENNEDKLETAKNILKKVNRAMRLLGSLDPQMVGKVIKVVKPSIGILLKESESDD